MTEFTEKPPLGEGWINGGYIVCEPPVFDYLWATIRFSRSTCWSGWPLDGSSPPRHAGFWQCMDTLRDKRLLESLWQHGQAPWRIWS